MTNLPEDILDRIRTLERQVRKLTTYVNSKPGTGAATAAGGGTNGATEQGEAENN